MQLTLTIAVDVPGAPKPEQLRQRINVEIALGAYDVLEVIGPDDEDLTNDGL